MTIKRTQQFEKTMNEVLDMISGFEVGNFSKTISKTEDPSLITLVEKLNSAAKILADKANSHLTHVSTPDHLNSTLLQLMIENMPYPVFLKDAKDNFKVKLWNKAAEDIFEVPKSVILEKTAHDLWPKEQADLYLAADQKVASNGVPVFIGEEPSHSKTRGTIYLRTKKLPLRLNSTSEIQYLLCVCRDITEHKKSKMAVIAKTEEMQKLIDGVPALISHWDINLKNLAANAGYSRLFALTPAEIFGREYKDVIGPVFARVKPHIDKALAGQSVTIQSKVILPTGEDSYSQVTFHPDMVNGKVEGVFTVAVDVTQEKILELERDKVTKELQTERLKSIRNAKLASLGEMSAGIAHEINNPLAIISSSIKLLPKFSNNPKKFADKVAMIQKSSERISRIVMGLKKFSRTDAKADFRSHEFCYIVKEACVLTDAKAKRHSTPVTIDCKTHSNIFCDEVEIEQVLVNLINNAIDAVKNRPEKWVKVSLFDEAESVVLRVTDSGPGISEEVRNKLFQPFFTTKNVGEGTGLGLSITKGILDEHKATIALVAESANTCFEIRFPRSGKVINAA